jgi:uncharacterized protein YdeI (YjbR/CyaY-like superfamily)
MNTNVDDYFVVGCGRCSLGGTPECKVHTWVNELSLLRKWILECGLTETCKWGVPCYTHNGKNVMMISAFKEYCTLSFFKGALIPNPNGLLTKPGERTQAGRILKITDIEFLKILESEVKAFIQSAIQIEEEGREVPKTKEPEPYPEELLERMNDDPNFKNAFESLTPGRQRGYLIYFTQAKQAKTRFARIDKCTPMILKGVGLHDKYQSGKKKN